MPQDVEILRVILHEKYRWPHLYHDIGLLLVQSSVTFNDFVLPACLSPVPNYLHISKDTTAIATGWGRANKSEPFSIILQRKCRHIMPFSKYILYTRELLPCYFSASRVRSDHLLAVSLKLVEWYPCKNAYVGKYYFKLREGIIDESQLCAGQFNKDICEV